MLIDRRRLLSIAGAALAAPEALRAQGAPALILPSPNFSTSAARPPKFVAGLRPWRSGSYRLETETIGDKFVVHNYGHGGAGVTMSWGCAAAVRDFISDQRATMADNRVAVLGAGVMGMTAASLLADMGLKVSIYAQHFTPETTSDVAGGQWAPSFVEIGDETKFRQLLKVAYETHLGKGAPFGVFPRDNYTFRPSSSLAYAAMCGAAPAQQLARLPFAGISHDGWKYPTLLVEPPIFLPRLYRDLWSAGVAFNTRLLAGPESVQGLTENLVVNCLGLGARDVWADPALEARKGELVLLPPQPGLDYLYSGIGYVFPRHDHLVVGGSVETSAGGVDDDRPDAQRAMEILKVARAVFDGVLPIPSWVTGVDEVVDAPTV